MIMKGWEAEGFECESTGHITHPIKQVSRARGSGEGPAPRTPGSRPASPPHSSGFRVASCPGWGGSLLPKPHPPQPSCLPWSPLTCCLRWSRVAWGLIVRPASLVRLGVSVIQPSSGSLLLGPPWNLKILPMSHWTAGPAQPGPVDLKVSFTLASAFCPQVWAHKTPPPGSPIEPSLP